MREKKAVIIVLNFNGKKDTLDCLKTIKKSEIQSTKSEIIVVDNRSTDRSVEAIRGKFAAVKIIENKENLGFAEGNNVGIRYALKNNFDYVLLLNNDTLVKEDFLVQLIKAAEKDKKIGIAAPKIYFASGFEFHKDRYNKKDLSRVIWFAGGKIDWQNIICSHIGVDEVDKGQFNREREIDFATGCCMLIRKDVFSKIGLFDKKYFLYWEDVDLCQRAKKASFKVVFCPKSIIWHKNASTTGGAGGNVSIYYQTRNRLLFAVKYASLRTKIAVLKEGIRYLFNGSRWQKKAVFDFLLLKLGKTI